MASILLIMLVIAGILLLITLNRLFVKLVLEKKNSFKKRIVSGIGLIIVNLLIMYSFEGVLGKVIFLVPFLLLGPSYPLLKKK